MCVLETSFIIALFIIIILYFVLCVYVCMYLCMYVCMYVCIYACMYVFYIFEYILYVCHTYSGDIKILFCLHKFPHAVTEVRACGTESPAIVGKARYAFAQLANHKKVSPLSDHTRTVPTTTRLSGLVLKVNVCGTCICGHPGSG